MGLRDTAAARNDFNNRGVTTMFFISRKVFVKAIDEAVSKRMNVTTSAANVAPPPQAAAED